MNAMTQNQFDVIVVGGGGTGLAAAIEAASLGASVVLLEKNGKLGGTTARSVGSVTSSCTPLQKAAGIEDSPGAHFEDMALFAGDLLPKDNLEIRRLLADNTPGTVRWLIDMGVVFFGPMPEPPHRVPRMHNILPNSRAYIYNLERNARKLGVTTRLNARVRSLYRDGGRIAGVEVEGTGGKTERLNAAWGVILASGDFSSDPALKSRFAPRIADVEGINPTSTGDGQSMAEAVGAEIVNGEVMTGPQIRFVAPPRKRLIELIPPARPFALAMRHSLKWLPSWLLRPFFMMFVTTNLAPSPSLFAEGAVLVNNRGERFTDETKEPQFAIPRQPDRIAHIVFDHQVASRFTGWPHYISTAPGVAYAYLKDYKRNRKDIYHEADSLEGLAAKLGVPAQALMRSIDAYNASRPAGKPAIVKAPFYALGPAKSWIIHTEGGVRINTRMEVLDRSGTPIPGLFAAGSAGQSGVMLEGHGHHLGWAFTSGRLAGRSAVQPRAPASVTKADDALLVQA